jgi:type I restriction enzyme S subunit
MVTKVLQYDILVASLDVGIVRTSPERNVPSRFIYGLLQQERFHDHVSGYTSVTTVLHLAKNAVQDFLAVVPGGVLMSHYESVASPLYERVRSNVRLSQTLSDLRDTLLPRLISGRLRVPEAEKLVEAVL